jgi:hypothetical protein
MDGIICRYCGFCCIFYVDFVQTVIYGLSPMGLESNNHCDGEGQQQFTGLDWKLRCNKCSAYTEILAPTLIAEEAPRLKTSTCLVGNRNLGHRSRRDLKQKIALLARTRTRIDILFYGAWCSVMVMQSVFGWFSQRYKSTPHLYLSCITNIEMISIIHFKIVPFSHNSRYFLKSKQ